MKPTLLALVAAGALAAGQTAAGSDPLDGWWRVSRVQHVPNSDLSPRRSYLVFHDGEFQGFDGCNGFSGRYAWTDGKLTFTENYTTTVFCRSAKDPDLIGRAGRIQNLVGKADDARRRRASLTLRVQGEDALELVRAPDTDRISHVGDSSHRETVLMDPRWNRRPSREQIAKAMSDPQVGADRSVQLLCAVTPAGALADCDLVYPAKPTQGSNGVRVALDLTEGFHLSRADTRLVRQSQAAILLSFP